jgi:hypothetical protein
MVDACFYLNFLLLPFTSGDKKGKWKTSLVSVSPAEVYKFQKVHAYKNVQLATTLNCFSNNKCGDGEKERERRRFRKICLCGHYLAIT